MVYNLYTEPISDSEKEWLRENVGLMYKCSLDGRYLFYYSFTWYAGDMDVLRGDCEYFLEGMNFDNEEELLESMCNHFKNGVNHGVLEILSVG